MSIRFELPLFLRPGSCRDLMRLGKAGDGGYVVSARSVGASESLLSLGVNDDWSFEEDFAKHQPVAIVCVDGSVSTSRFQTEARIERARAAFALARGRLTAARSSWRVASERSSLHSRLTQFFDGVRHRLISDYVGPNEWQRLSWSDLQKLAASTCFVKIDIEGAEYRILRDLADDASRMSGLVVEFHDADLMVREIESIAAKLSEHMLIVHVHANNCSAPIAGAEMPPVLEVTWASKKVLEDSEQCISTTGRLPIQLDQPNDIRQQEIEFFW